LLKLACGIYPLPVELDFILFADAVESAEGDKLDIRGAAWDTIRADRSAPIVHDEMSVIIRVLARPEETLTEHELELALLRSDNAVITSRSGVIAQLAESRVERAKEARTWRLVWVIQLRDLEFPAFGEYEFSVRVNGIELGRSPLNVRESE
jgi:hypothetical protein